MECAAPLVLEKAPAVQLPGVAVSSFSSFIVGIGYRDVPVPNSRHSMTGKVRNIKSQSFTNM